MENCRGIKNVNRIFKGGAMKLDNYFESQDKINQGLAELLQGTHESVKELTEMVKNLNTRLSALEIAVKHIEEQHKETK